MTVAHAGQVRLGDRESWAREVFELASDGIFIADLDGRYTDVNSAGCRMLGYTRDELVGTSILDLIPGSEVPRLAEEKRTMLLGRPCISEWRLRCKDGRFLPVEVSANILPDGRWLGFVRDLTESKAAEAARRLDEQRLRVALASAPISMFNQDRDLRYTWAYNPPTPISPEDIIGHRQEDLAPEPLAQRLVDLKRSVLDTGIAARTEIEHELPWGRRWFDLRIEPLRDEHGDVVGITGAAWDVTERKRDEDGLRLLGDLSSLLEVPDGDWKQLLPKVAPLGLRLPCDFCIVDATDEEGHLQRIGFAHVDPRMLDACAPLAPLHVGDIRPQPGAEAVRPSEPLLLEAVPPDYLRGSWQDDAHVALLRSLDVRSLIAVPLISRGHVLGRLVFGSSTRRHVRADLQIAIEFARRVALLLDRIQLQNALERAVRARDETLAIVVHDLRNPLNSVLLQSEILSTTLEENSREGLAVDRIRHAVRRMNRLIQDLVDVVRLDAREALVIRLDDVVPDRILREVVDAMRPLASAALIELVSSLPAGLPMIRADHDRLVQLLENLLGNAIKFSPRGALVTASAVLGTDEVVFSVADSGPGISPEQHAHLFERFWQGDGRDRRGIGLGLYVVKGIVDAHHGRIWVDSAPGRGSTFHFAIPISAAQSTM